VKFPNLQHGLNILMGVGLYYSGYLERFSVL